MTEKTAFTKEFINSHLKRGNLSSLEERCSCCLINFDSLAGKSSCGKNNSSIQKMALACAGTIRVKGSDTAEDAKLAKKGGGLTTKGHEWGNVNRKGRGFPDSYEFV